MKICNIVITWNRCAYVRRFMKNYFKSTKVPHTLVIADNGSVDGTRDYLKVLEKDYKFGRTPPHIKLLFRYYIKNFGPLRVENHFLRYPVDPQAEYYGRLFSDVDLSNNKCEDWIKEMIEVLEACPEVASIAPLDRDWDAMEDYVTRNGKTYIKGTLFEFSEEYRITRKSIYETFGRPKYNLWTSTPTLFFDKVRAAGLKTAVSPNIKLIDFHSLGQPDKLEHIEAYRKHIILSKRIYADNRIFQQDTGGLLEWEEDETMHCDESEPINEVFAPEEMLRHHACRAALDPGVAEEDIKLFKEGDRTIEWSK